MADRNTGKKKDPRAFLQFTRRAMRESSDGILIEFLREGNLLCSDAETAIWQAAIAWWLPLAYRWKKNLPPKDLELVLDSSIHSLQQQIALLENLKQDAASGGGSSAREIAIDDIADPDEEAIDEPEDEEDEESAMDLF